MLSRLPPLADLLSKALDSMHPTAVQRHSGGKGASAAAEDAEASMQMKMKRAGALRRWNPAAAAAMKQAVVTDASHGGASGALLPEVEERLCPEAGAARRILEGIQEEFDSELIIARRMLAAPSLGWKSVKTGVSSSLTHMLELRRASAAAKQMPGDWVLVSSTKASVRYHTPGVIALQCKQALHAERLAVYRRMAWTAFVAEISVELGPLLKQWVTALGEFDALQSLGRVARLPGYTRPIVLPEGMPAGLWAAGARHPLLEAAGGMHRTAALETAGGASSASSVIPNPIALGNRMESESELAALVKSLGVDSARAAVECMDRAGAEIGLAARQSASHAGAMQSPS